MSVARVHGDVDERFGEVRTEFERIVAREDEDLTAQLAVVHRGRLVVDLCSGPPTAADRLLALYSASKGVMHLVVAALVQDGTLDLDAPVVHYWPEFGAEGKSALLLRELFSHQSGVVGTDEGFSPEELTDDHLVAERLARQRPFWRPGRASGYHALVMGALSAEVVRRATGTNVQELFATVFRDPLALDLFLGVPPDQDDRFLAAQPMAVTPERRRALEAGATAPDSIAGIAFNRQRPDAVEVWDLPNRSDARRRGTASFGGIGNARGLARLYAAAACGVDGAAPLLTPATVAKVSQIQSNGHDLVLGVPKAWAVGFHSAAGIYPFLGAHAFGHSGAGGQQSLVDPSRHLAYAFLRRRAGFPDEVDHAHRALLTAACRAVDGPVRGG